jgi:hypothetical protein
MSWNVGFKVRNCNRISMMYYEAKSNCNLREREEIVYIWFHNLVIINQLLYIVYCYYFYSYELCGVISL